METLKSMTGFATLQKTYNSSEVTCEIRALNSRYLEISMRLPRILTDLEAPLKEIIRQKVTRGKIMYSLNFSSLTNEIQNLKIQPEVVKSYMQLLEQVKMEAGITAPIQLEHLLSFKDILSFEESSEVDETLSNFISGLTDETLERLNEMRAQEAQFLKQDLEVRLNRIDEICGKIQKLGKENPQVEFQRLYNRLLSLLGEEKVDRNRLEMELAIIGDKVDITEEVIRLRSHLELFRQNLSSGSPVGKKLNFILQEMNRETNTMSNKATMIDISHLVVQLKEDIEKIREQVQNIE